MQKLRVARKLNILSVARKIIFSEVEDKKMQAEEERK
jgi:hypothetical protein